jgi:DNA-directed RNA polymerase specialized sigma24 family protein
VLDALHDTGPLPASDVSGLLPMEFTEQHWQTVREWAVSFFRRHPPCAGEVMEDLVEETLVRVREAAPRLTPALLGPFTLGVAKNVWRESLRRAVVRIRLDGERALAAAAEDACPGRACHWDQVRADEWRTSLEQRLGCMLGARTTSLLMLTRYDGYTLAHAAGKLGMSEHEARAAQKQIQRFLSNPARLQSLL